MHPDSANNSADSDTDKKLASKLRCPKCRQGQMVPAVEEGDPEYTDNFVCQVCHHRDTIPTKDLLFGQVFTAISGSLICFYLLITKLTTLFQGMQHGNLKDTLSTSGLVVVSGLFLAGFIYILFRAQEGFKHRRRYIKEQQERDL